MSHELRTPLNAVIGFAELMAAESFGQLGDARYREYAANIRDSGRFLLGRINDILDFSKLDSGRLVLDEETIDLDETLASVRKMVAAHAAEAGVGLMIEAGPDLLCVNADPRRMRQVLFNLMNNAIKFTPSGGKVTVTATRRDAEIAISIADTGIGIAPDDIPTALERFGQIDGSLARVTRAPAWGCRSRSGSSNSTVESSNSRARSGSGRRSPSSCQPRNCTKPATSAKWRRDGPENK